MFRINGKYHYYEDPIYEPYNNYYAGFGERQMKRFHTALHHVVHFYTEFNQAINARKREAIEISDAEFELHEFARQMTIKAIQFRDDIFKFTKTNRQGEWTNATQLPSTFEYEFMKQYDHDRWIKPIEVLENQKYVKFKNGLGYGKREQYNPPAKQHQSTAQSEFHSFVHWSHWLDYLLNGLFEGEGESGTGDFDLAELNQFIHDCDKYLELVKKVDYLVDKNIEFFSEVGKK